MVSPLYVEYANLKSTQARGGVYTSACGTDFQIWTFFISYILCSLWIKMRIYLTQIMSVSDLVTYQQIG